MSTPTNSSPVTEILLPSRGLFYGGAVPDGKVKIRQWTMHELSVLESQGAGTSERIRKIIDDCCILPGEFKANQLLVTDRFAILLFQRNYTLNSAKYKYEFKCVHCGNVNRARVMNIIDDFNEKLAPEGATEPFPVHLPDRKSDVMFRLLRGYDEPAIIEAAKRYRMASGDPTDPSKIMRMARQIVSIDGNDNVPIPDRESFARKLSVGDGARFQLAVDAVEPCLDTDVFVNCNSCGSENVVSLEGALSGEFFRPTIL